METNIDNLTVSQLRISKKELEHNMNKLINDFIKSNGIGIDDILVHNEYNFLLRSSLFINVSIELEKI